MTELKKMNAQTPLGFFERIATWTSHWAGTTSAFVMALGSILVWLAMGPHFNYSNTWQLVINTGTTIVTFLMVFLIQRAQNRETMAIKIQISELIASLREADNQIIDLEKLSESQLAELQRHYQRLSRGESSHQEESTDARTAADQRSRKVARDSGPAQPTDSSASSS